MPTVATTQKYAGTTPKIKFVKTRMARMNARAALVGAGNADTSAIEDDSAVIVSVAAHEFRMKGTTLNGKINATASKDLATVFHVRESQVEVDKRVTASRLPIVPLVGGRADDDAFYREVIDIPLRPKWTAAMGVAAIARNEEQAFESYLQAIYDRYPPHRLNHFEHNLNVWKQLWKCCDASDLLVVVADARHPLFHFPPSLYRYVVHVLGKPFVLALNKIDLISKASLQKWFKYFEAQYPQMHVVTFSSFPQPNTVTCEDAGPKKRKDKKNYHPVGIDGLWSVWRTLLPQKFAQLPDSPEVAGANASAPLTAAALAAVPVAGAATPAAAAQATATASAAPATATATASASSSSAADAKAAASAAAAASASTIHAVLSVADTTKRSAKVKLEHETKKDRKLRRKLTRKAKSKIVTGFGLDDFGPGERDDEDDDTASTATGTTTSTVAPAATAAATAAAAAASSANRFAGIENDDDDDDGDDEDEDDAKAAAADSKAAPAPAVAAAPKSGGPSLAATGVDAATSAAIEAVAPKAADVVLTIGMIGHPNAGKSSLINALTGKYSVGVSATPGYTKNIQTVRLGTTGVQLCDCPGLVFPAVDMPKPLQLLCGIFPFAQVREPFSAVRFLAERLPLVDIYGLRPVPKDQRDAAVAGDIEDDMFAALNKPKPGAKGKAKPQAKAGAAADVKSASVGVSGGDSKHQWSAWDLCESAALLKGYRLTAGRLDAHRAGMDIVSDALTGQVVLSFDPPAVAQGSASNAARAAHDAAQTKAVANAQATEQAEIASRVAAQIKAEEEAGSDDDYRFSAAAHDGKTTVARDAALAARNGGVVPERKATNKKSKVLDD